MMPSSPHIFVVGSYVAACSVKVDRLPSPGETLSASAFVHEPGGKGFNQAMCMRRLGATVDGLLAVGNDTFGDAAAEALRRYGLPASMLVAKDGPSGVGVGFIDRDGETCIAVYQGANALLSAEDSALAADRITAADMVTAQFEAGDAAIAAAFAIARTAGVRTMLNPSPFRPIAHKILEATDYLVLNAAEFQSLTQAPPTIPCEQILAKRALGSLAALVLTLGPEGSWTLRDQALTHMPAFPVQSVDGIGAGDAFLAGLACGLATGQPWPRALREASACGALATTRVGVLEALPGRNDIDAFLAE